MQTAIANPLQSDHAEVNAEFQPYGDVTIVSTFGQPQAEYAAIHKACGMIDLPQRAVIEFTGKDRLIFLNNLLTNQVFDKQSKTPLAAGAGKYAFLLNAKTGRIIADMNVLELPVDRPTEAGRTLLEIDSRLTNVVLETIERYRFAEQVSWRASAGELHEIALHGPGAIEIINGELSRDHLKGSAAQGPPEVAEVDTEALPASGDPMTCGVGKIIGYDVVFWRDDPCAVPGLHLVLSSAAIQAVWNHLNIRYGQSDQLGKRALRPAGWAAFNACRIEAGRGIFGIDFDDSILPAESGQMHRAVSLTKGCYPGQEIVARMHARQQVAKKVVGIKMIDDALPIAAAQIYDEAGNGIGAITSSTVAPVLSGAAICLGIVKRPWFEIGTKLTIPAEGSMRSGTVVETPFK